MGFPLLLNKALAGVKKRWRRQQCSHLPLLAKRSNGVSYFGLCGVKKHGSRLFTSCTLLKNGCSEWASGLSLGAEQSIGWSQEAWIGRLDKVDFVTQGHVQSGQVGFPLLLNKALKWCQETWIWAFYKLHSFEEGMFRVGKWAFPCCSTKH